jgi:hypothetical protein
MFLKRNTFLRIYHKLVETRWLFTFTASCTATIVGISLTFGINSCRESRRIEHEARESIMQSVENIHTRSDYIDVVLDDMVCQDSLFNLVSELYSSNKAIPDSLSRSFMNAMILYRPEIGNDSFEKMFLGSYELWRELDQEDFTYCLSAAFALANSLEDYCHYHHQRLYEEMEKCAGLGTACRDHSPSINKTKALIESDEFCFYMASRSISTKAMLERKDLNHQIIDAIDQWCISLGYIDDEKDQ